MALRQEADLDFIEADAGGWHSDGSGNAWVKALSAYPTYPDGEAGR